MTHDSWLMTHWLIWLIKHPFSGLLPVLGAISPVASTPWNCWNAARAMTSACHAYSKRGDSGRDPFNQNSDRSDREKRTTSKGGPVFSKLFLLDRTFPLSFGPKFPEILVEWIAPSETPGNDSFPVPYLHSKWRFIFNRWCWTFCCWRLASGL